MFSRIGIIEKQFFPGLYLTPGEYSNPMLGIHNHDFGIAVGAKTINWICNSVVLHLLVWMISEANDVPFSSGVNVLLVVQT